MDWPEITGVESAVRAWLVMVTVAVVSIRSSFSKGSVAVPPAALDRVAGIVNAQIAPLLAALMAGFGSVISEVGASMMVGGNIPGRTRTLSIALYDHVQALDPRAGVVRPRKAQGDVCRLQNSDSMQNC